ncbi:hypothetical protein NEAUS05_1681 [Nematocida ausubeli]|nr:hypothetical protein NEAUS07_1738 [Nematocida ausubeli]KAI5149212.1 hypothetical protein NEAUS05_1681 [Nematocida ausubeli]
MNESYSKSACRIPEGRDIKCELEMKEINGLALEIDCYLKKIKYAESMLKNHETEMAAAEKNKHDSKQCYMLYLLAVIDFGRTYLIGMKAFLEYLSLIDTKTNLLYKVRQAEAEYARAAEEEFEAPVIEVTKSTAAMGYTASNLNLQNYVYIWESNAISRLVAKTNEYIRICISEEEQKEYREIIFNLSTLFSDVKCSILKTPKPCYVSWVL